MDNRTTITIDFIDILQDGTNAINNNESLFDIQQTIPLIMFKDAKFRRLFFAFCESAINANRQDVLDWALKNSTLTFEEIFVIPVNQLQISSLRYMLKHHLKLGNISDLNVLPHLLLQSQASFINNQNINLIADDILEMMQLFLATNPRSQNQTLMFLLTWSIKYSFFATYALEHFDRNIITDTAIEQELTFISKHNLESLIHDNTIQSSDRILRAATSAILVAPQNTLTLYERIQDKTDDDWQGIFVQLQTLLTHPIYRPKQLEELLLIANKLEKYLETNASSLNLQNRLFLLERTLIEKTDIYFGCLHEFNLSKENYRRLLKVNIEQLRNHFSPIPLLFQPWKAMHANSDYTFSLLKLMEGVMIPAIPAQPEIPVASEMHNRVLSFFQLYFSIMENAGPQHLSLIDLLHDCMELIKLRFNNDDDKVRQHFAIHNIWKSFLRNDKFKIFFEEKLLAVKNVLASLNTLTTLTANSASPFIALLTILKTKEKKIAELEGRVSQLESQSIFSKKRPREEDVASDEPQTKNQRTLDSWLKKK